MPATVEEIEIRFGTNADATARAVDNLKGRIDEVKKTSSSGSPTVGPDYEKQIDRLKKRVDELKEARKDAFKKKLSMESSWSEVDDADNKIRDLNEAISNANDQIKHLEFRSVADDMVDTSTKSEILAQKIEGLGGRLAKGLSSGKWDDYQIASTIGRIQDLSKALEAETRDADGVTDENVKMAESFVESSTKARILEGTIAALKEKLAMQFQSGAGDAAILSTTKRIQLLQENLDDLIKKQEGVSDESRDMAESFVESSTEASLLEGRIAALKERLSEQFQSGETEDDGSVIATARRIKSAESALDSLRKKQEETARNERGVTQENRDMAAEFVRTSTKATLLTKRISDLQEKLAEGFFKGKSEESLAGIVQRIKKLQDDLAKETVGGTGRITSATSFETADNLINSTEKIDILSAKYDDLRTKLAEGLEFRTMDDGKIARTIEQLQKYEAQIEKISLESDGAASEQKKLQEAVKNSGKESERSSGGFSKFGNTLKRLIVYRALRSIISGIASAAKEGYQDLIRYSNAINSADAAQAASTANAYATSLNQVKNAAASALGPLAQSLLPVIQTVSGWFIAAANAVNQFISALQGKSTYTRATGVAIDYAGSLGGIEDSASGASKAVKELERTILSFDEINALNGNNAGGGGGGGGSGSGGGVSASDMFEEAAISSNISAIADKVKEVFGEIKKYAEPVINFIRENVGDTTLKVAGLAGAIAALGGSYKIGVGIVLSIVGFSMEYDAIKNIASGNGEIKDYVKAAIGSALGVAGSLLIFGTGPLGWTIGLGATLTVGISAFFAEAKEMQDTAEALSRTGDAYQRIVDIMSESGQVRQESMAILSGIETAWNGIEKAAKNAALSELYALQTKALMEAQIAAEQYDLALQELEKADKNLRDAQGKSKQEVLQAEAAYNRAAEAVFAAEGALRASDVAVTRSSDYIDKLRGEIEDTSLTWDSYVVNADGSTKLIQDAYKNIQESAMEEAGAVRKMRDEAKKHLEDHQSDINYTKERYSDYQKAVKAKTDAIVKDVGRVKSIFFETKKQVDDFINSIKRNAQLEIKVKAAKDSGQNYGGNFAEGGFPKAGSFFWAGENNVPELMGTIGGHTAVASGREITGITAAVNESSAREAMLLNMLIAAVNALADSNGGGGGITTTELMSAMKRQNRRDGTTTFAV